MRNLPAVKISIHSRNEVLYKGSVILAFTSRKEIRNTGKADTLSTFIQYIVSGEYSYQNAVIIIVADRIYVLGQWTTLNQSIVIKSPSNGVDPDNV